MPSAPRRPCPTPGCRRLTHARRCEPCERARRQDVDARRGTAAERGYGTEWRRIRSRVLREEPVCTCGEPTTDVDHLVPLRAGGTNDRANLRARCHRCHSQKTAREDGGFGNRRRRVRGAR